ncbi:hypothetical protein IMG5_113580, partial [Ichthyophthirius multifiliis]
QIENDLVKANLDITIQGSPCHLLALDQQDDVGSHIADYIETLTKTKIINGIESPYTQFGFNTNSYSPYDNMKFILEGKNDFDQYLKIIPVQYHYNKKGIHTNQYKYAIKQQEDIPQITFKYEVSPINIVYNTQKQSFYHFLVQVCAIVGGIFSVIGIINSLTSGVISKIRG